MTKPLHLYDAIVLPEWVDYNGHMNDAAYAIPFSRAIDAMMAMVGLDEAGRVATNHTIFTLAMQMRYHHEVKQGEPIKVSGQIIEMDAKRIRLYQWLRHGVDDTLLATCEQLLASVDQSGPKIAAFPERVGEKLRAIAAEHAELPIPDDAGQGIALKRK
ncbi:MAG: thioesterase [Alphaproteobacteria bacterium]|nr:thioesterase family protein [Beijerinckiaceae bacterium]NBQ39296.1 thioesterase [Alphaproteobacteria bacterium]